MPCMNYKKVTALGSSHSAWINYTHTPLSVSMYSPPGPWLVKGVMVRFQHRFGEIPGAVHKSAIRMGGPARNPSLEETNLSLNGKET